MFLKSAIPVVKRPKPFREAFFDGVYNLVHYGTWQKPHKTIDEVVHNSRFSDAGIFSVLSNFHRNQSIAQKKGLVFIPLEGEGFENLLKDTAESEQKIYELLEPFGIVGVHIAKTIVPLSMLDRRVEEDLRSNPTEEPFYQHGIYLATNEEGRKKLSMINANQDTHIYWALGARTAYRPGL